MRALFPRWHVHSLLEAGRWSICDLTQDDEFFGLLGRIAEDQSLASRHSWPRLLELSTAIAEDILELQQEPAEGWDPLNLEYLQLEVSLMPMMASSNNGDIHITHDWIINSSTDAISSDIARPVFVNRFFSFLYTTKAWIVANRAGTLLSWFRIFYYYCRARSALHDAAEPLVPAFLLTITFSGPHLLLGIDAARFVLDWAATINPSYARRGDRRLAGIA
jgi:hypothetical protein